MDADSLAYSNSSHSLLVQALCRDLLEDGINLNTSAADEMLRFFRYTQGHSPEQAVGIYLLSGRQLWGTLRQIIAWRFGSLSWGGRLLDFASGYGRVTRHIVADVPKEWVWVSDIYAEGVAFQQREFGVHGIVSTTDPEDFRCNVDFDCIQVSSLFTHLPEGRFVAWLRRLGSLVKPEGLLIFSVHDMSLKKTPEPAGIVFEAQSESGSLDTLEYGTSWVTEDFVRSAVRKAIGTCPVLRIPRGLGSFQDLYVVLKTGSPDGAPFSGLKVEREADGFLEHCSWMGQRSLLLSGWSADRVLGRPPQEVRIRIDGVLVASCRDLQPRPAMGQAFASDPMQAVGWQARVDLPASADSQTAHLTVRSVASDGEELGLYSGPVLWACLRSAQFDAVRLQDELGRREAAHREELARQEERTAELAARLRAVEASRFWKARNLWFALKRTLRLTTEP